jgi:hypothetical protein
MAFCCSCGREVGEAGTCPICGAPQRATLEPRPQAAAGTCAANRPSTSGETEKKTAKYHKEPGLNWADAARLLATIAFVNISRYYGWQSVIGFLLLLAAFLLLFWLLMPSLRFLWRRLLQRRWAILKAWWVCKTRRCDYYQTYQAYGPPDLTHVGYHAAERLAIEHFVSHSENAGSSRGFKICKNWAERLRGEFWSTLTGDSDQIGADAILETKKRQFGFLGGDHKVTDSGDE